MRLLGQHGVVRLASCFIRCVLHYGQKGDGRTGEVHFRDARQLYTYSDLPSNTDLVAIDDGGLQCFDGGRMHQVALLEAKRDFQVVDDGTPVVTDAVLGQLVGEALALKQSVNFSCISDKEHVGILAVATYVRLFSFHITDRFITEYKSLDPSDPSPDSSYIIAHSTKWLDMKVPADRRKIVHHLLALVAWADDVDDDYQEETGDKDEETSDEAEETSDEDDEMQDEL